MAWPNPSSWQSGEPLSLWFQVVQGDTAAGPVQVCATQGRSAIARLQRKLNALGGLLGPSLTVDGNWGDNTMRALINVINRVANASTGEAQGYFRTVESQLAGDMRSHNISRVSAQAALWVTYYLSDLDGRATRPMERIAVPTTSVFPRYGRAPDDDRGVRGGDLTCWDRDRDHPPAPATRAEVDRAAETARTGTTQPSGPVATRPRGRGIGAGAIVAAGVVGMLLLGGGGGSSRRRRARRGRR